MDIKKEYIDKTISMLEGYLAQQRRIAALRYEFEHIDYVTEDEMIGQMALPGKSEDGSVGRSVGHISDKTMYIALNYRNQAHHLNSEESGRILEKLTPLEAEAERLEFYVGLLPPHLRDTLKLHYFQGLSWAEVARALFVTESALVKRRRVAVEQLADLLFLKERGRE